jgi:membrane protease YdiL (CAAX protease family)
MNEPAASLDPAEVERLTRSVRSRLRAGIVVTVLGIVAMLVGPGLGFRESMGIGLFYLLMPAVALAQLPLLRVQPVERIPVYLGSGATILAIGAIAVGLGWETSALPAHGVTWVPAPAGPAWISGVTIGGLAVIGAFGWIERRMPNEFAELVLQLIPRTGAEKRLFVGLSLAAGLGEELAYRGYALSVIQLLVPGPWTGAALSSVAFGVLHAYQGPVGMVRTSVIGLILAGSVIFSGSLLPAIIGHTLIDLVAGFVIGPRMLSGREGCRNLSVSE